MSRARLVSALSAALVLAGCGQDAESGSGSAKAQPEAPTSVLAVDGRDQYELARAMLDTDGLELEELITAHIAVGSSWRGRRYRWEMMRVDALCTSAERCLFAPFDHGRFDRSVDYSFLPRVRFSEEELARLDTACRPHAPECVVALEATLSTFVLETGSSVRMELSDAHVVGARRRAPDEHFMSRPERARSSGSALRGAFVAATRTREDR